MKRLIIVLVTTVVLISATGQGVWAQEAATDSATAEADSGKSNQQENTGASLYEVEEEEEEEPDCE